MRTLYEAFLGHLLALSGIPEIRNSTISSLPAEHRLIEPVPCDYAHGTDPMSIAYRTAALGRSDMLHPSSWCHIRIGYIPSMLISPKIIESGECTESALLYHVIHGLYPVGFLVLEVHETA